MGVVATAAVDRTAVAVVAATATKIVEVSVVTCVIANLNLRLYLAFVFSCNSIT